MQKKSWQTRTARLAAGTLAAALALGAFTGCGEKKGEGDKALTKVTVNEVTHSVFYAPQYAAINLGFFEEEGIDIDLSVGQGTDKVMTGVLSGSIDVGFGGPEAAIYIYNEGKENYSQVDVYKRQHHRHPPGAGDPAGRQTVLTSSSTPKGRGPG